MLKNVIMLDIDDCIYPNSNTWAGSGDPRDDIRIAEINIKRLKMICDTWNFKICIISSMSASMNLTEDGVEYKLDGYVHDPEVEICDLLRLHLKDEIIALEYQKSDAITGYIKDPEIGKVLVIDDTDFSNLVSLETESYYLGVRGYIRGIDIYNIKQFMEGCVEQSSD